MDRKYMCYCGLYCGNCATKANVEPAAQALYRELRRAGFEDMVQYLPDGPAFWNFLTCMAEEGTCVSCRDGSGNPGCEIRVCAKGKGVGMCALCDSYPCDKMTEFMLRYPMLYDDNALIRDKGIEAWAELQDARKDEGYTYLEAKGESAGAK